MAGENPITQNNLAFLNNPGEKIGVPNLDPAFMVGRKIYHPILGENRRGELLIPVGVPNSGGFRRFQAPEISLIGEEAVSLCFGLPFSLSQLDGSGPSQATNRLSLTLEEGETPEECAIREVLEESGVEIKNVTFRSVTFMEKMNHCEHNARYPEKSYGASFTAEAYKIPKFVENREVSEIRFVPLGELGEYWNKQSDSRECMLGCARMHFRGESK